MEKGVAKVEPTKERRRGARGSRGWRRNPAPGAPGAPSGQKYRAPTPGLEEFTYDCGAPKDAANFTIVTEKLCNYFQSTFKMGSDVAWALRNLQPVDIPFPDEPGEYDEDGNVVVAATAIQEHRFKREFDAAHKREEHYQENMKRAYATCYEHCTPSLKATLKGDADYPQFFAAQDAVVLLRKIKALCCRFDATKQPTRAIVGADKGIYLFVQKNGVSNDAFFEQFNALVDTADSYGSNLGLSSTLTDAELVKMGVTRANATNAQITQAAAAAREAYLAMLMLDGAHESYRNLKEELDGDYAKGSDTYPTDRNAVLRLLNQRQANRQTQVWTPRNLQRLRDDEDGVVFAQGSSNNQDSRTCYRCGKKGHISASCPAPKPANKEQLHNMAEVAENDEEQLHAMADEPESDDGSNSEEAYFFGQFRDGLNRNWVLLDSQSSTDMFCNPHLITNIRTSPTTAYIRCNAGVKAITKIGDFHGFDKQITVRYDPDGICNIVSFKTMKQLYPITYDSRPNDGGGAAFQVHTPRGIIAFKPCGKGLHYIDLSSKKSATDTILAHANIPTIRGNFEGFTKRDIEGAIKARKLQAMIGSPNKAEFENMVRSNLLQDCDVLPADITNAHTIFGPDLISLRGRTVRQRPERVEVDIVDVPRNLVDMHRNCVLSADIMFVNGIPFLITRTRKIQLVTIEFLPNRTAKTIGSKLARVIQFYRRSGYNIQTALMDREFSSVQSECPNLPINTCASNEHVPEIERAIRTVKERARGIYNILPFKTGLPRLMIIELLHFSVLWLNAFPVKSGISTIYSPRELVARQRLSAKRHCRTPFGTYCEVHDEPTPSNTMEPRTSEAICMGPTGNIQGSYKFYCLRTRQRIVRRRWTELPMPRRIIDMISQHAIADKTNRNLQFSNRHNVPLDDPDHMQYIVTPDPPAPFPSIPDDFPEIPLTDDSTTAVIDPEGDLTSNQLAAIAANNSTIANRPEPPLAPTNGNANYNDENANDDDGYDNNDNGAPLDDLQPDDAPDDNTNADDTQVPDEPDDLDDNTNADNTQVPDEPPEQLGRGHRLRRPNQFLTYPGENVFAAYQTDEAEHTVDAHMHATLSATNAAKVDSYLPAVFEFIILQYGEKAAAHTVAHGSDDEIKTLLTQHCMSQYSLKAGLRRFGKQGELAVTKELGQFHDLNVFVPVDHKTLTEDDHRQALASLIFLKEKRDGTIKARACADGRKQRDTTAEEEAASPTVSIESVFMTCAIEAQEGRDVAVMDLPGAFLHADCNDHVIMRFQGRLAELMAMAAPTVYRKYITINARGEPTLFVKLQKALYGMLKSALLFYKKLVTDLTEKGFTVNPYDPCVVTKFINGKQMTICWHVDDLKISHADPKEVTKIEEWLRQLYGKVSVSRGTKHTYLGMQIEYTPDKKCRISMTPYTNEIITSFPEVIDTTAATPAADHLFKVRELDNHNSYLPNEQASMFHRSTAQLLFLSGRARRDIQVAVAFLTTRVKHPDEDDWGKLKRVLRYLKGTADLSLNLSADGFHIIHWYIDASFAAHDDCKGHTGAMMTMGDGAAISFSRKQRINARSSTESEIIGIYDTLPSVLHCKYFLQALGYNTSKHVIYQDNKSAMMLARNGKVSSSKRTKHIHIRYFFIKDCLDRGLVAMEHRPTQDMWSDILTKPKQGKEFFNMRAKLMGTPTQTDHPIGKPEGKQNQLNAICNNKQTKRRI